MKNIMKDLFSKLAAMSCIALAVMLVSTAQAADETLTLACKGTETSGGGARTSSEVINIGIIVDFQKKTVVGLEPTTPLTIDGLTETTISFAGAEGDWSMNGTIDRMTGSLTAASGRSNSPTLLHDLQCRPTQCTVSAFSAMLSYGLVGR